MAERYFDALIKCLVEFREKHNQVAESGNQIELVKGNSYVRVSGCGLIMHCRLEHPKDGAERKLSATFHTTPQDVVSDRIDLPVPMIAANGRLVWQLGESEIRPNEVAVLIMRALTGTRRYSMSGGPHSRSLDSLQAVDRS